MYKIYAKNPPQGLQTPEVTSDTDLDLTLMEQQMKCFLEVGLRENKVINWRDRLLGTFERSVTKKRRGKWGQELLEGEVEEVLFLSWRK